jgi:hypothetical protein
MDFSVATKIKQNNNNKNNKNSKKQQFKSAFQFIANNKLYL